MLSSLTRNKSTYIVTYIQDDIQHESEPIIAWNMKEVQDKFNHVEIINIKTI